MTKKIYCKSVNNCSSSHDFSIIGKSIKSVLGDFSWASSVFLLAERKAETSFDYWFLASMYNYYPDKAFQLLDNAISVAVTSKEFSDISFIFLKEFNDFDKCRNILATAERRIKTIDEYLSIASNYYKFLNDIQKTKFLINKAYSLSQTFEDKANILHFCIANNIKNDDFDNLLINTFESAENNEQYAVLIKIFALNYPDKIRIKETYSDSFYFSNSADKTNHKHISAEFINRLWADELFKKAIGQQSFSHSDTNIYRLLAKSINIFAINPSELMFTYRLFLNA